MATSTLHGASAKWASSGAALRVFAKKGRYTPGIFNGSAFPRYLLKKRGNSREFISLKINASLSDIDPSPAIPKAEENGNALKDPESAPSVTPTLTLSPNPSGTDIVDEDVEKKISSFSAIGEFFDFERPSAVATTLFWVASAFIFGSGISVFLGSEKGTEFFAGYLLEQSLSVDNLFVFVLIFKYFQVPAEYQGRVLTYGIAGAVVFRAIMIILGVASIQQFEAVNLLFAGILIYSSYKLMSETEDEEDDLSNNSIVKFCQKLIPVTSEYDGNKFYTIVDGARKATPLFLTLAIVELSDVAFAVDSIPAVFGVTRDPFIVFSSNIFAILGLRSLYTLISSSMRELHFLQPSISIVLGFIGFKMAVDFLGIHIPTEMSLGVVAGVLGTGVFLSLRYPKPYGDS